jgi:hypothetical protein
MKQGIILVSVKDENDDHKNPYRTGGWVVMKEAGIHRIFSKEYADQLMKTRFGFITDTAWKKLGLPCASQI